MGSRSEIFLKMIGIKYSQKIVLELEQFLFKENRLVLYKEGKLHYIKEGIIFKVNNVNIKTYHSDIFEFDGIKIKRIDRSYYLGTNVTYDRESQISGGSEHSNNNNNNNNGNNGNNG